MNLNFSISELVKSDIAKQYNIDNHPNLLELDNLLNLIFYCLQPIRISEGFSEIKEALKKRRKDD